MYNGHKYSVVECIATITTLILYVANMLFAMIACVESFMLIQANKAIHLYKRANYIKHAAETLEQNHQYLLSHIVKNDEFSMQHSSSIHLLYSICMDHIYSLCRYIFRSLQYLI